MTISKRIFSAFICLAIVCGDAFAAQPTQCRDIKYAQLHPDECPRPHPIEISNTTATIAGGALLGGAAIALGAIFTSSDDNQSEYSIPRTPSYNMVGDDVDVIQLAGIWQTHEYTMNQVQYDDIRLGYSLARGHTGAGTNIAVLDANNWHGKTVTDIAGGIIAPDANVKFYSVANEQEKFISYREIGDIIASAADAHVFNASWSVGMRARDVHSREHIAAITDANFINQMTNAATQRDAIFVFAAGNDFDPYDSSALSAIPLVVPEMNGHFVNVVAWDSTTGALAIYSNACGPTKNYCITAPGTDIQTETTFSASGTSFAAPIVSAAIAVIRDAFPYMTAGQVTSLLFETARDLGTPGVDTTYGHGMLDLERATRPVGVALVPVTTSANIPLETAHVSGAVAENLKDADLKFAFVDSYGRAFTTRLNDNISIRNPGRAFARLTNNDEMSFGVGNLEMGFSNTDLIFGDGFLQTDNSKNLISFIGARHTFNIGNMNIDTHARFGIADPRAGENSMIESFDNITVANIGASASIGNWKFGFGIPDTIIGGTMDLRMPVARAANGDILYGTASVDMASRPSYEYTVEYKFISAGFIDNPFGTDEAYVMARGKWAF